MFDANVVEMIMEINVGVSFMPTLFLELYDA